MLYFVCCLVCCFYYLNVSLSRFITSVGEEGACSYAIDDSHFFCSKVSPLPLAALFLVTITETPILV